MRATALLLIAASIGLASPAAAQVRIVPGQPDPNGGFLGVTIVSVGRLVLISHCYKGYPAKAAGLRAGDLLIAIDGKPCAGTQLMISKQIGGRKPGTPVHLRVLRGDKELDIKVPKLAKRPDEGTLTAPDSSDTLRAKYYKLLGYDAMGGMAPVQGPRVAPDVLVLRSALAELKDHPEADWTVHLAALWHCMVRAEHQGAEDDKTKAFWAHRVAAAEWLRTIARLRIEPPRCDGRAEGASETLREKIARLVKQLGARSYKEREAATVQLGKIGGAARPALEEAAQSKHAETRQRAKALLGALADAERVEAEAWLPCVLELTAEGQLKPVHGKPPVPRAPYRALVLVDGKLAKGGAAFTVDKDGAVSFSGQAPPAGSKLVYLTPQKLPSAD